MKNAQVIGIIGYNFCGSTFLSRLLCAIPGVKAGGELHWIFPPFGAYETKTVAGWSVRRACVTHGRFCKAFTPEFIGRGIAKELFYDEVARQLNARVLVSSDKLPQHYKKFCKPNTMDGIVLFKSPRAAVWSDFKNERRSIVDSLKRWTSLYKNIIEWAPTFSKRIIFLSYHDIAQNPLWALEIINQSFALAEEAPKSIDFDEIPYCFIGGNPGGHQKKGIVASDEGGGWTKRSEKDFGERSKLIIDSDLEAKSTYDTLMQRATRL